jgi:hypothetical protein
MHYARLHPATILAHLPLPEPASSHGREAAVALSPTAAATHIARMRPVLRERVSMTSSVCSDVTGSSMGPSLQGSARTPRPCDSQERQDQEDSIDGTQSEDSGCAEQAFDDDTGGDLSPRDDSGEDEHSGSECYTHRFARGEAIVPTLPRAFAAIRGGNLRTLQKLLLSGLDISQSDPYGHTVLTEVLRYENVLALQLLKPYLAKLEWSKRNRLFSDALDLAIANGNHLMVGVIGNAGGELKAFHRDE